MLVLFLLGLHLLALSLAGASPGIVRDQKFVLPFKVANGPSTAEVVSVDSGLDLPKLTPHVNDTTFDSWYFDAVSFNTSQSISIAFYNFGKNTLDVPDLGGALVVQVSGTFTNGTTFLKSMPATRNATLITNYRGAETRWYGEDGEYSFVGDNLNNPDIGYIVRVYDDDSGISGSVMLGSVAAPRYPCYANIPGMTEKIVPNFYSANAVPDADATVEFEIDGESFGFEGSGYHDKKWGDKALKESVDSWYWGHGRIGLYSIVWSHALGKNGKEYFSSWISDNGKTVFQSCKDKSVVVRPWSKNATNPVYTPKPRDPAPDGYDIRFDVEEGETFVAHFQTSAIQMSTDTYKRMTGPIFGGFEGQSQYHGVALCEQVQN